MQNEFRKPESHHLCDISRAGLHQMLDEILDNKTHGYIKAITLTLITFSKGVAAEKKRLELKKRLANLKATLRPES